LSPIRVKSSSKSAFPPRGALGADTDGATADLGWNTRGEYGNDFGKAEIISAVNAMVHNI
jgi:hypothetical protein